MLEYLHWCYLHMNRSPLALNIPWWGSDLVLFDELIQWEELDLFTESEWVTESRGIVCYHDNSTDSSGIFLPWVRESVRGGSWE